MHSARLRPLLLCAATLALLAVRCGGSPFAVPVPPPCLAAIAADVAGAPAGAAAALSPETCRWCAAAGVCPVAASLDSTHKLLSFTAPPLGVSCDSSGAGLTRTYAAGVSVRFCAQTKRLPALSAVAPLVVLAIVLALPACTLLPCCPLYGRALLARPERMQAQADADAELVVVATVVIADDIASVAQQTLSAGETSETGGKGAPARARPSALPPADLRGVPARERLRVMWALDDGFVAFSKPPLRPDASTGLLALPLYLLRLGRLVAAQAARWAAPALFCGRGEAGEAGAPPAAAEAAEGGPGSEVASFLADLRFFYRNNHGLLGLACAHPLAGASPAMRAVGLLGEEMFRYGITFLVLARVTAGDCGAAGGGCDPQVARAHNAVYGAPKAWVTPAQQFTVVAACALVTLPWGWLLQLLLWGRPPFAAAGAPPWAGLAGRGLRAAQRLGALLWCLVCLPASAFLFQLSLLQSPHPAVVAANWAWALLVNKCGVEVLTLGAAFAVAYRQSVAEAGAAQPADDDCQRAGL